MRRTVTGVDAATAARLQFASEWLVQSSLPMLLAHRKRFWQANAALLALMRGLEQAARSSHTGGEQWPAALREAVLRALEHDHPQPVHECALGTLQSDSLPAGAAYRQHAGEPLPQGLWCNLYFIRVSPDAVLCILVDVSACVASEQQLALAEKTAYARDMAYAVVYGNMEEVAFHIRLDPDNQFRFVSVNHAFCAAADMAQEAIVGKLAQEVIPAPSFSAAEPRLRAVIATGASMRWEQVRSYPAGEGRIGSVSIAPVLDAAATSVKSSARCTTSPSSNKPNSSCVT